MINIKAKNKYLYLVVVFFAVLLSLSTFIFFNSMSYNNSYIFDNADILDSNMKSKIVEINTANEKENNPKFIIYTTNSLKNQSIASYSKSNFSNLLNKKQINENDILITISTEYNIIDIYSMNNNLDKTFINDLVEEQYELIKNKSFINALENILNELNDSMNTNNSYEPKILIDKDKINDFKGLNTIVCIATFTILLILDLILRDGKTISYFFSKLHFSNPKK